MVADFGHGSFSYSIGLRAPIRRATGHGGPQSARTLKYTTNAIEALNSKLHRAVRARGHFLNDEAALKLLFLVLNRAEKEWKRPPHEWVAAKAQMAVMFGKRFATAMSA